MTTSVVERKSGSSQSTSLVVHPHLTSTRVSRWRIPYPRRGIPDMGKKSARQPTCALWRSDYLEEGGLVALHLQTEVLVPFFVGRIIGLFKDSMRVRWLSSAAGKSVFNGTYHDVKPKDESKYEENINLSESKDLGEPILLHWDSPQIPTYQGYRPMLTKGRRLSNFLLRLAWNDIRLTKLGIRKRITELTKCTFD